jgi:hypothetical protein
LPAASMARTLTLCLPSSSFLTLRGEVQGLNCFLLALHSNVESGSEDSNFNLTLLLWVLFGARLVIMVSGGGVIGPGCLGQSVDRDAERAGGPGDEALWFAALPSRAARPTVPVP